MKSIPISLIIAVYKRPDALEKIFVSLLNQTYKTFEIIIADDGSPKEIADLIETWQGRFSHPIRHVWHEDIGFRKTIIINRAVCESLGEYLVFIDGDCILHHKFLEDHWQHREIKAVLAGRRVMMNEKKSSAISSSNIAKRKHQNSIMWLTGSIGQTAQYAFRIPAVDKVRNIFRQNYFILGSNFSLHREDFISLNGYDERIIGRGMEDNNLHARVIAAGMPIRSLSQQALQYHIFHRSDPIPHSVETVKRFCAVESGWTEFGIKKSVQ